jgi:predicted nicotinamide N-methyase
LRHGAVSGEKMARSLLEEYLSRYGSLERDPLCPEILVWNTIRFSGLWKAARALDEKAPVPYWGIVWPGGRGLARYVLDNPQMFAGRRVLDIGTGSGICAVAAAMAGATVTGVDISAEALELAQRTADANGVACRWELPSGASFLPPAMEKYEIILAGDLFNEEAFSRSVIAALRERASCGVKNIVADSGRAFRPRSGFEVLCAMKVPVFREIEGVTVRDVNVMRLVPEQGRRS